MQNIAQLIVTMIFMQKQIYLHNFKNRVRHLNTHTNTTLHIHQHNYTNTNSSH
jgi:hypothetical protein